MNPAAADAAPTFSLEGFRRGFAGGQPLAPGTFVYGMVFGVLAGAGAGAVALCRGAGG